LLLERAGDAVTREELLKRIWPSDTFVDFEHGLNTAIKELRGALSDSASEPRYIETLPKLGYRVISPVEAVAGAVAGVGVKGAGEKPEPAVAGGVGTQAKAVSQELAGPRRWHWVAALVIGAVIVAGLLAIVKWRRSKQRMRVTERCWRYFSRKVSMRMPFRR
jgi:hypothetical protein